MKIDDRRMAYWLVSSAVLLAMLVYGRPFLVPLVFALLVWAVLNALTDKLKTWHLPAWLAWCAAFAAIAAALYFVTLVLTNEAAALAAAAPSYATKLQEIWQRDIPFSHLVPSLDFASLLKQSEFPRILGRAAASIGNMIFGLALVVIYVGFLLAEQRHLPAKLARLQRESGLEQEGELVIRAMGAQIQSYLGVCTFLSLLVGVVCYVLLRLLGVDFAGFWALVMFLLTYIPTIGGFGPVLPALMALAQFGDVGPALVILVVLGTIHFFLTNVVETVMLGRSLNLSPFVIIVSLTFWGLIWGIGGLFLAVPMTGAVAIACRHLEGMGWIADLLAGPAPKEHNWRWRPRKARSGTS